MDLGKTMEFLEIEKGLKELNVDISLDVPVRRSGDWTYLFTPGTDAVAASRKGYAAVYHAERYICAIDRGDIPEIKVYDVEDGYLEIPMSDIHKYEDSKVSYAEVLENSPYYDIALTNAQRGDDNYTIAQNGKVFLYTAMRWGKVRGRVSKLGWRHTFEALLRRNVPGITRSSLSKKFSVDMLRYPMGAPEEVHAALFAE